MQEEIWKDVPSFEGMYQVSNLGRVKSLAREVLRGGKYLFISKEIILKIALSGDGYYTAGLSRNNKTYTKKVHHLMAISFLNHTPCGHKIVIDHINNDPLDNRLENLQLISNRENLSKDKSGLSKYTGLSWKDKNKKWQASIRIDGKKVYLGLFKTELEAHEVYQNKLKEILINK
jgi:hypothetical protein